MLYEKWELNVTSKRTRYDILKCHFWSMTIIIDIFSWLEYNRFS